MDEAPGEAVSDVVDKTRDVETDEVLETGYGPGAPQGDNLCNDYAQGLAVAFGELAGSRGERVDDGDVVTMTDGSSPSLFGNVVVLRRPIGDREWPEVVEHVHGFYAGRPGGPFLVFSAWSTPDLTGDGFGRIGHPPLMFRPARVVEQEADRRPRDPRSSRMGRRRGTGRTRWSTATPTRRCNRSPPAASCPAAALDAPRWRHWVAYLDDRPVAHRRRRTSATTTSTSSSSRRWPTSAGGASAER